MAKLGAFNDDLHTQFVQAARMAAELNLDGLAVRAVAGRNIADLPEDEVRNIRRVADDHGLEIASIGSQFGRGFHFDDAEAGPRAEAHLGRALRYADICGTRLVRVFAGWLRGQEPLSEWQRRPPYPQSLDLLVEKLRPSVLAAEASGTLLMFELEGASYVGTVAEFAALRDALNSPAVALCWDVCNAWWSGERPADGLARIDGLPLVDVQTKEVLASEANPEVASFDRTTVGQGDIGYSTLLPELLRRGYGGYITAERVHHPVKPEEDPSAQQATLGDIAGLKKILGRA
jgi:sugar phosphate isomerase/epimerase